MPDPTRYAPGVTPGVTDEDSRVLATALKSKDDVVVAIFDTGVDMPDPANPADTGHPGLRNLLLDRARNFSPGGAATARPDNDPAATNPRTQRQWHHRYATTGCLPGQWRADEPCKPARGRPKVTAPGASPDLPLT